MSDRIPRRRLRWWLYEQINERIKCAEMLIRVLGWQREEAIFAELPDYDKYTVHVNVKAHRYVTDWEADPADELTAITEELGLYD